ncbi:MAG: radical SAM protein [Candidatus Riflebacteria bacterium]|nr:radical SAM protein [Candidatus Riflebacteria bacterium]
MAWYPFPALAGAGRVDRRGQDGAFDVVLVSGDAFVDHPAFPAAVVARILEGQGLRVAVIAQPRWDTPADFTVFGAPRLFFGVTAGAMDSMVANFTSMRFPRKTDRLSPGGRAGMRPKRAVQVYVQRLRQAFPEVPIVVGGIEASLRRFAHYDFWEDRIRDPLLVDAPADLLVYGMAEAALPRIVDWLRAAAGSRRALAPAPLPQACFRVPAGAWREFAGGRVTLLPSAAEIRQNPRRLLELALVLDASVRPGAPVLVQPHPKGDIVCFPPALEDWVGEAAAFDRLPFNREAHPLYDEPIPGLEPVQFSVVSHRGCLGACSFCALGLHQGRRIRSRSAAAILAEIARFPGHPAFRGTVPDLGGPSVNMYGWDAAGSEAGRPGPCGPACPMATTPGHPGGSGGGIGVGGEAGVAGDVGVDGDVGIAGGVGGAGSGLRPLADLLRQAAALPGIRHVFLGSGLRYDLLRPADQPAFHEILRSHVSGQLKVAPEHLDPAVLTLMRKGPGADFAAFVDDFRRAAAEVGRDLFLVPYFMTAFPGAGEADGLIAAFVRRFRLAHEQIQEFTPTPGTVATAMYATGLDLRGNPIAVARTQTARRHGRQRIQSDPATPAAPRRTPPGSHPSARPPARPGRRRP